MLHQYWFRIKVCLRYSEDLNDEGVYGVDEEAKQGSSSVLDYDQIDEESDDDDEEDEEEDDEYDNYDDDQL